MLLIGVLEPGLAYYLGFIGISYTSAMHASIIYAFEPLGILIINVCLFRYKLKAEYVIVFLVSLLGMFFLAKDGSENSKGIDYIRGDLLILIGVLMASLYVALSSRLITRLNAIKLLFIQQVGSLCFIVVLCFWDIFDSGLQILPRMPIQKYFFIIVLGVIQFGLSFLFYFLGAKYVSGYKSILILSLTPVIGILASAAVLGEEISRSFYIGSFIIMLCMTFLSLREK